MISRACYVRCDRCGDPAPIATDGAVYARRYAKEVGFLRVGRDDVCLRCRDDENAVAVRLLEGKARRQREMSHALREEQHDGAWCRDGH